jgi:oxygen-independent coproporphyrinogen-3 oxidase
VGSNVIFFGPDDCQRAIFTFLFAAGRCGYCDFNTFAGLSYLIPEYVNALCCEVESVSRQFAKPQVVDTIFFGGGTHPFYHSLNLKIY